MESLNDERVRAVLCDLGGVVFGIDFDRAIASWAASAACDPTVLRRRFCFDEAYEQHERGRLDVREYFAALRQTLGVDLSDRELLVGWNDIYLDTLPGVTALLCRAAERMPVYAFTNSNPTHEAIWRSRFAKDLNTFRTIFVSSDLGVRKPDREAFVAVAAHIGLEPPAILFLDDNAENVEGARHVGMPAVVVTSVSDLRDAFVRQGVDTNHSFR